MNYCTRAGGPACDALSAFGLFAVTAMLACYGLEHAANGSSWHSRDRAVSVPPTSKNSFAKGRLCASTRNGKTLASHPRATARLRFSLGDGAIRGPDFDTKLARQKNRAGGRPAPKIQDAHSGMKRETARQALRLAQGVLPKRVIADPSWVVPRREGERCRREGVPAQGIFSSRPSSWAIRIIS
jgi:hypothetical protein